VRQEIQVKEYNIYRLSDGELVGHFYAGVGMTVTEEVFSFYCTVNGWNSVDYRYEQV